MTILTGGVIAYTVNPVSGAGATLSSPTGTIQSDGTASVTATANGTLGSYTVTAAPRVGIVATFDLSNTDVITGSPEPTPINAVEGQPFTNSEVATFVGSGALASYSASINWGDGTTASTGVVVGSAGSFRVLGSHTYAEEGTYTMSVSISGGSGATGSASDTANVADAPITGTASTTAKSVAGASAAITLGTLTDTGGDEPAANYAVTINWGDGKSSAGALVPTGVNTFNVTGAHTYAAADKYTASYFVRDEGGQSTPFINVTVNVAKAITAKSIAATAVEGQAFAGKTLADFSDGNTTASSFTATITWGDGASFAGSIVSDGAGGFYVKGSHTYVDDGKFTEGVSIKDNSTGATATVGQMLSVGDALLTGTALTTSARVGQSFDLPIATFLDGDQLNTDSRVSPVSLPRPAPWPR